jgi:hypothetical protein
MFCFIRTLCFASPACYAFAIFACYTLIDTHVTFQYVYARNSKRGDPVMRPSTSREEVFRIGLTGHSDLALSVDSSSSTTRRQPISPPTASPPCESKETRTSNSRLLPMDFVEDSRAGRNRALSPRKASIPALSPRSTLCERTNCGTRRPLTVYFRYQIARGT